MRADISSTAGANFPRSGEQPIHNKNIRQRKCRCSKKGKLILNLLLRILSESGLIELKGLEVTLSDPNQTGTATTTVSTTISVRDRQSAAFAGTIKKKKDATFGGPSGAGAVFTFNQGKGYSKNTSNFVVFVTPIIKASASSGVDQVKKKFRLKE